MACHSSIASRTRSPTKKEDRGLGGRDGAGGDSSEVIVITDSEEDSDKVISVSGSGEEEEESSDQKSPRVRRFEPNRVFCKCKIIDIVDDVSSDSDEEESTDFESDENVGGHKNGRLPNVSRKRTPSVTKDGPEADLSFTNVSESLSADGENSSSSEEYMSWREREKNTEIRKKRKCKDRGELSHLYSARKTTKELDIECTDDPVIDNAGKKEDVWANEWLQDIVEEKEEINVEHDIECLDGSVTDEAGRKENVECGVSWVNEWLLGDMEEVEEEEEISVEHDIGCLDDPVTDEAGRKENVECGVSWVNKWLLGDVEEVEGEESITAKQLNAETNCPSDDENGNSGQMEGRGSFSLLERKGMREKEETRHEAKNGDEGLQADDDEEDEEEEEGTADIELDGVNAGTDVSFVNEEEKIGKMEESGNFYVPEKQGSNKSREKSTSQIKVSRVDRRMQENRYGKHVQSDSDPVIGHATLLKVDVAT